VGVLEHREKFLADLFRRKNQIHVSRFKGCTGHSVVAGRLFILNDGDASECLDGPYAVCTVRSSAGKNDTHDLISHIFCKGGEEEIDRRLRAYSGCGFA
jgi:hypothetical protein